MHHFNEAIRLFREVTDAEGMARAVAEKYRAISVHGALTIGQLANVSELEDALSLLGDDYPVLRARIKNSLVDVLWTARHRDQAAQHAREALQLALDAGDPSACAEMYSSVSMTQGMSLHMTDAIESLELGMEQAQTAAPESPCQRGDERT